MVAKKKVSFYKSLFDLLPEFMATIAGFKSSASRHAVGFVHEGPL